MGLQGVPLTRYSGMRPSPIVWGPRSNFWMLIQVGNFGRNSHPASYKQKVRLVPARRQLALESTIISAKRRSEIAVKNVNFVLTEIRRRTRY